MISAACSGVSSFAVRAMVEPAPCLLGRCRPTNKNTLQSTKAQGVQVAISQLDSSAPVVYTSLMKKPTADQIARAASLGWNDGIDGLECRPSPFFPELAGAYTE